MRVRGSVCRIHKCKRAPSVDGMCKTHAKAEADRLFSLAVRSVGKCQEVADGKPHVGNLQCAHVFSRSYHTVRWHPLNAVCACAGHHTFYTHHPIEWTNLMIDWLGFEVYYDLQAQALTHRTPDLGMVLDELRAAAA